MISLLAIIVIANSLCVSASVIVPVPVSVPCLGPVLSKGSKENLQVCVPAPAGVGSPVVGRC